jgi:hypothetical protein
VLTHLAKALRELSILKFSAVSVSIRLCWTTLHPNCCLLNRRHAKDAAGFPRQVSVPRGKPSASSCVQFPYLLLKSASKCVSRFAILSCFSLHNAALFLEPPSLEQKYPMFCAPPHFWGIVISNVPICTRFVTLYVGSVLALRSSS